jgi:divalent metal cation (Fe/Co/Zn/Cd) transporter
VVVSGSLDVVSVATDPARRSKLVRRGLRLEYATLSWNVVGSVIVLGAAAAARSVALAGFGLDSLIEILASTVVIWQLLGSNQHRERLAMRIIGAAFLALAVYITLQSLYVILEVAKPHPSPAGIAWLAATVVAMLLLAMCKDRTGRALGNALLSTEARVTLIDGAVGAAVLIGLILNTAFGWWWADPVAGLVIVYYGLKEGRAALANH